ncbi:MAG: globin domain-containing protein [Alphaproteobacteria bacterium]|nr:globin domain-containing protein [Alphaproteobacteria bacterium]
MSPEQKALVQETWQHVVPIADTAAILFYDRLFEIDPKTRDLFHGVDLARQGTKLTQAIDMVVGALDRLDELAPVVADLGRRHAGYGVTDAHYDAVGAALIWTLEKGLGDGWSDDARDAWSAAYAVLAGIMQSAAAEIDNTQTVRRTAGTAA